MDAPILLDQAQWVGESLNLIRTAEVLLIDPATWEIVYRGPLDDRLTYEAQKPAATEHYLRDALDAVLAGRPIETPKRDALGCLINLPKAHTLGPRRARRVSVTDSSRRALCAPASLGCFHFCRVVR